MTRRMKIILISAAASLGLAGAAAGLSAATSNGWEHARYGGKHHGMQMVCDQGQDTFSISLRCEAAIAVALADFLQFVVQVSHGALIWVSVSDHPTGRSQSSPVNRCGSRDTTPVQPESAWLQATPFLSWGRSVGRRPTGPWGP